MSPQSLQEEINAVRQEVHKISGRLDLLELSATKRQTSTTFGQAGKSTEFASLPVPSPSPVFEGVAPQESSGAATPNSRIRSVSKLLDEKPEIKTEKQDVEIQIGTVWLNRIGIGSLVLGIVFLLLYSYQTFGVAAKLLIGYLASTALIFGGEKICKQKERDWYGNALIGGGWSLMYFTAYAMHFIPTLKVIDSFAAELFILCGISAGAMRHAVHKNSETLALLSTILGVASILFGEPSNLSYIGYLGITAGAAYISIKKKWTKVLGTAISAAYIAHFYTSAWMVHRGTEPLVNSIWSMIALLSNWLVFNTALITYARDSQSKEETFLVFHWLKAVYVTVAIFTFAQSTLHEHIYLLFLSAAAIYMASAHILQKLKLPLLTDAHTFFGLSFLTVAIGNKVDHHYLPIAYLAEAVAVASIHLKNKRIVFGAYGPGLMVLALLEWLVAACKFWYLDSVFLFISSPVNFFNGALAVVACAVLSHQYYLQQKQVASTDAGKNKNDHSNLHKTYAILANIFGMLLPILIVGGENRVLFWLAVSCTNWLVFFKSRLRLFHSISYLSLLFTTLASIAQIANLVTPVSIATPIMIFGFDWLAAKSNTEYKSSLRWFAQSSLLLALALVMQLPTQLISVGLGVLGLASLSLGFGASVKVYRAWGLATLGILSLRLIFVDLAHENTLERIIAFTASGAILLLGSYAYAKFGDKKIAKPQT